MRFFLFCFFRILFLIFPSTEPQGMATQAASSRAHGIRVERNNLDAFFFKFFDGFPVKCGIIMKNSSAFKRDERAAQATLLGIRNGNNSHPLFLLYEGFKIDFFSGIFRKEASLLKRR